MLTHHVSVVEVLLCFLWSVVKTLPSSNSYFKMNRDCALRILDTKRLTGAVSACEGGRNLLHRIAVNSFFVVLLLLGNGYTYTSLNMHTLYFYRGYIRSRSC